MWRKVLFNLWAQLSGNYGETKIIMSFGVKNRALVEVLKNIFVNYCVVFGMVVPLIYHSRLKHFYTMTAQQIQSAQELGRTYAADNHMYIFEGAMNADGFAAAALANYNANAEAFTK